MQGKDDWANPEKPVNGKLVPVLLLDISTLSLLNIALETLAQKPTKQKVVHNTQGLRNLLFKSSLKLQFVKVDLCT